MDAYGLLAGGGGDGTLRANAPTALVGTHHVLEVLMDELINLVSQRTGLPADKSRVAVESVLTHLKGRLPAPLAAHLDAVLQGGAAGAGGQSTGSASPGLGGLGNLAGEIGGLFGGKSS